MTSRSYSTPKGIVHDSWILLVDAVDAFFRLLEQPGSHHIPDARGGIRGVAATLSHKKHHWTQGAETPICITSSRECHGNHPSIGFHTARIVWAGSHLGRPRQTWCNCRVLAGYCEDLWRVVTTSHETPAAHMSSETGIPEREDLTLWLKGQKKLPLVSLNFCCSWHRVLGMGMGNNLAALAATTMLEGDLESKNCIWYVYHGGMQTVTQSQFHLVFDTWISTTNSMQLASYQKSTGSSTGLSWGLCLVSSYIQ